MSETVCAYPPHFKGVKELFDSGIGMVPSVYVRPEQERPSVAAENVGFPIIDLADVIGLGEMRAATVRQIAQACKDWGFFQVINHGVPEAVIDKMLSVAQEFHALPNEDKMRYFSTDISSRMRYATSFNVKKDKVLSWRDFLRHECLPLAEMFELWPDKPTSYRETVSEYTSYLGELGGCLLEAISEGLGLPGDYIKKSLGGYSQIMALNYYPPCPEPQLTFGLPGHSDPGIITMLLQDQVGGLQVLHDEAWCFVKPVPYAFIVNIADQLQILSNNRYKSIEHRAIVNKQQARISIPVGLGPAWNTLVEPAPELIDDEHPAVFKPSVYRDYMLALQGRALHRQSILDMLRI